MKLLLHLKFSRFKVGREEGVAHWINVLSSSSGVCWIVFRISILCYFGNRVHKIQQRSTFWVHDFDGQSEILSAIRVWICWKRVPKYWSVKRVPLFHKDVSDVFTCFRPPCSSIFIRDVRVQLLSWFPVFLLLKFMRFLWFSAQNWHYYFDFALFFSVFSNFQNFFVCGLSHLTSPYFCWFTCLTFCHHVA